jgi:hypothetical protein
LRPSKLAVILQYCSGPSFDFLAKILGVSIQLLHCDTQFCFPDMISLIEGDTIMSAIAHSVAWLPYHVGDPHHVCNGFRGLKFNLFF